MTDLELKKKNQKLLKRLVIGVIFMFGFAYLLVPLYTLVCKQAGINGKSANIAVRLDPHMKVDTSRTIDVEFTTTVHGPMQFVFRPLLHHVLIHPGETKLVYFYAQNNTGHGITVQAIPSITPDYTAKFLKKTECFCFTQQYFFTSEKADMPVYFYIDPSIPHKTLAMTLSYTLFDATHFEKKQKKIARGRIDLS